MIYKNEISLTKKDDVKFKFPYLILMLNFLPQIFRTY